MLTAPHATRGEHAHPSRGVAGVGHGPDAAVVCALIESDRIGEAVHLTRALSGTHIYQHLIRKNACARPSEGYLRFLVACARYRAGQPGEVEILECAAAALVTALAPLPDSLARAGRMHGHAIATARIQLEQAIRQVAAFNTLPGAGREDAAATALRRLDDVPPYWSTGRTEPDHDREGRTG